MTINNNNVLQRKIGDILVPHKIQKLSGVGNKHRYFNTTIPNNKIMISYGDCFGNTSTILKQHFIDSNFTLSSFHRIIRRDHQWIQRIQ